MVSPTSRGPPPATSRTGQPPERGPDGGGEGAASRPVEVAASLLLMDALQWTPRAWSYYDSPDAPYREPTLHGTSSLVVLAVLGCPRGATATAEDAEAVVAMLVAAKVNVDGVEPLTGGARMAMKMRDDVVTDGGYPDKVLSNAPDRAGPFYTVPKVVE